MILYQNIVKFSWLGYNLPWTDWQTLRVLSLLGGSDENRVSKLQKILKDQKIEICQNPEIRADDIFKWSQSFFGDINNLKKFKCRKSDICTC